MARSRVSLVSVDGNECVLKDGTTISVSKLTKCNPPDLKLEVGKFYKTRHGRKGFCYFIDLSESEYHQAHIALIGYGEVYQVSLKGIWHPSRINTKDEIIEEWRD